MYDSNGCGGNDDFLSLMDADCEFEARMSGILCSVWSNIVDDVTIWGPILDFRNAWIKPGCARGDLFAAAANVVIEQVFPEHSVLVMLAYPLEYQGVVDSPARQRAVLQRRKAMVRYYRRCFGVEPLPGKPGRDAWLWRPNVRRADRIERPRASRQSNR